MHQLKDRPVQLCISQKVTLEKQSKNNILCKNFLARTNLLTVIIPQNTQLIHSHFEQNHHQTHFASQEILMPEDSISGNPITAYISSDTAITFRELTLKVT